MATKNHASAVRLFSVKRLIPSCVLGFLLPLCYMILLSSASDYTHKPVPEFLVWPFGWPRPIWIFLMGRQPTEADLVGGLIFIAACNVALYGTLCYAALLTLSMIRKGKRADFDAPPPPPDPSHFKS